MARRRMWTLWLVAIAMTGLIGSGSATAAAPERRSYTGWINGAEFRVDVPARWNGTLVLFSHGYLTQDPPGIRLANRVETETWLLDHGYALAASDFLGVTGATYEQGLHDQLALLDWIDANVRRPRRTVALGQSSGAVLSVLLAERNPGRLSGVASLCAPMDLNGQRNFMLDVSFAIKTLLAPNENIELVHVTDPERSTRALQQAVNTALTTPQGRARLALAAALGNVPGWVTADARRPADLAGQLRQQAAQLLAIHTGSFGPRSRVDLERRAGGNPSWNIGIDYGHQLARSRERDLVGAAYLEAGPAADLDADLDLLAAAPRIGPDLRALAWLYRFGVPRGTTPAPVLTLHNVADAADPGNERWYAGQVRRSGDPDRLRQLYTDRAGHCSFSAAEEIVVLRALFARIETGRWPALDPRRLNAAAAEFDPTYHRALNLATFKDVSVPPAFTRYTPSPTLRPSR